MERKVYEVIAKQTGNAILERRTCKRTGEEFPIFQLQKDIEDTMGVTYQQNLSPASIFRSICMFRNERHLYKNTSQKSGKSVIAMYPSESGVNVYDTPEFRESDFILPGKDVPTDIHEATKIFNDLLSSIPKQGRINDRNENAEYANYVGSSKNIYMSFIIYYESQDVYYSYAAIPGKDIMDCSYVTRVDLAYEGINLFDSYGIFFCLNINNSQNCYFSIDLDNCHHCLFCHNLRGKAYHIYNKEYTKEEFEQYFSQMKKHMKTHTGLQIYIVEYEQILASALYKHVNQINSQNCAGDALIGCNQSILVFDSHASNESVNIWWWPFEKCLNMIWWCADYVVNSWRIGAGLEGESSSKILGCYNVYTSHNIITCQDLIGCSNMLLCCGLKNKEYCILNRQFSKEEREKTSKILIHQMKEAGTYWAPPVHTLSSFPYNDTTANDLFPIKSIVIGDQTTIVNPNGEGSVTILQPDQFISDAILDLGGEEKIEIRRRTRDVEINIPENAATILAKDIPDNIDDVQDDILDKIIICEISGRPFRIIAQELAFYRKHGMPIPHRHHDVRWHARKDKRTLRNLYVRTCDACSAEILSVYDSKATHKVYCEDCYNKEIYW